MSVKSKPWQSSGGALLVCYLAIVVALLVSPSHLTEHDVGSPEHRRHVLEASITDARHLSAEILSLTRRVQSLGNTRVPRPAQRDSEGIISMLEEGEGRTGSRKQEAAVHEKKKNASARDTVTRRAATSSNPPKPVPGTMEALPNTEDNAKKEIDSLLTTLGQNPSALPADSKLSLRSLAAQSVKGTGKNSAAEAERKRKNVPRAWHDLVSVAEKPDHHLQHMYLEFRTGRQFKESNNVIKRYIREYWLKMKSSLCTKLSGKECTRNRMLWKMLHMWKSTVRRTTENVSRDPWFFEKRVNHFKEHKYKRYLMRCINMLRWMQFEKAWLLKEKVKVEENTEFLDNLSKRFTAIGSSLLKNVAYNKGREKKTRTRLEAMGAMLKSHVLKRKASSKGAEQIREWLDHVDETHQRLIREEVPRLKENIRRGKQQVAEGRGMVDQLEKSKIDHASLVWSYYLRLLKVSKESRPFFVEFASTSGTLFQTFEKETKDKIAGYKKRMMARMDWIRQHLATETLRTFMKKIHAWQMKQKRAKALLRKEVKVTMSNYYVMRINQYRTSVEYKRIEMENWYKVWYGRKQQWDAFRRTLFHHLAADVMDRVKHKKDAIGEGDEHVLPATHLACRCSPHSGAVPAAATFDGQVFTSPSGQAVHCHCQHHKSHPDEM